MTQDLTPATVAKMLEGVTPGPWTSDVCRNVWGSAPGSHGKIANLSDRPQAEGYDEIPEVSVAANARFIAWAREAVPALAAKLAEVMSNRDDFVAKLNTRIAALEADSKAARDAASGSFARAEAAEAEVARLREAINLTAEQALKDEIPGGYIPLSSADWHAGYDIAIGRARAALQPKEADHE